MSQIEPRVTLVSSQPYWGGGEQWLWSLGQGLSRLGCEVSWVAPAASELFARAIRTGQACTSTQGRGARPSDLLRVRRFLQEQSPDVVQMNDGHAVTCLSVAGFGLSRSVRVAAKHTLFPMRSTIKYRWLVDRVICVSKASQQTCLDGGLPSEKTALVYGGIEPPEGDPEDRSWALAQLGWPEDTRLLLAVGSLLECKGHRHLIEAMSAVCQADQRTRLAIAGEGEERAALVQLIAEHGLSQRVGLLGFRSDARRWISAADVVVQPSLSEALSLVAIEAQMLGKPLVATNVGGLAEVVMADEPEPLAEVVPPADAPQLARALSRVLAGGEPIKARAERARQQANRRFHVDRMASEVLDLYQSLLR